MNIAHATDKVLDKLKTASSSAKEQRQALQSELSKTGINEVRTDQRVYKLTTGIKKPCVTVKLLRSIAAGDAALLSFVDDVEAHVVSNAESVSKLTVKSIS